MSDDDTTKPTPDPTILTTEQLLREVDRVKELTEAKIDGLHEVFNERFESVETQFALIERQRVEQKKDTKDAVDAALAAAKEAVKEQTAASEKSITKSETASKEQINQQNTTFTTANAGFQRALDDIKTRVERIENIRQGGADVRTDRRAETTVMVSIASVVLAALAIVVTILLTR